MNISPSPVLWREMQRTSFTQLKPLLDFLEIPLDQRKQFVGSSFPINVPIRLAEKMEKRNPRDPLFLQFVPLRHELEVKSGFELDPIQDEQFRSSKRLLKKYKGRALLLATSACAMHCRYCFRQNFDYDKASDFSSELELIRCDESIHEVILSGGDPLSLSDEKLKELIDAIESIPHVTKLRFHSRFIVGIPQRVDDSFLSILENRRLQVYFILHINHPKELDCDVIHAVKRLRPVVAATMNQSVLLQGINDNFETQLELCESLVNSGIIPYYLHQLDKVEGAAHFEVSIERGHRIIQYLREHLPGYAVPKYVREIPHHTSKTPL